MYVREAHPTDGWILESNSRVGIEVKQPTVLSERFDVAEKCCALLEMSIPLFVDDLNDRVGRSYSGMPDRLYLIDRDGRVAYKGGRGPYGFKPAELEQSLILLLQEDRAPGSPTEAASPPGDRPRSEATGSAKKDEGATVRPPRLERR